ncbi:MAG: CRISPR-associated protein Csx14 [Methanoregula sp.]|nr:CRISPR-associated protein Csx14 [Methanoregula sp.]
MKTAVIVPLGMSPPVVTAGMDAADFKISHLIMIATRHPAVQAGRELIGIALSVRAPKIRIYTEVLSKDDITTPQENFEFMETAIRLIRMARVDYGCDRVLLNVAGGRKNACITLAMIGQLMNVDGVYHISNPNIGLFNEGLERLRRDIDRIHEAKTLEEKQEIYREKKEQFDHVLFPPRSEYQIIRVPTFPVDQSSVQRLLVELRGDVKGEVINLPLSDKAILERHGILEKGKSKKHYYVTEYGQKFLDAFI